ncbi:hypothetical protein J32TS6_25790 [Virgibacillus pantothenticus]|nr:hypothetical protein J32TS6_25790 [Virgibacillus pantothenticus]
MYENGAAIKIIEIREPPIPMEILITMFLVSWMITEKIKETLMTTIKCNVVKDKTILYRLEIPPSITL